MSPHFPVVRPCFRLNAPFSHCLVPAGEHLGLGPCEVLGPQLEDLLFSDSQVRVRGKGSRVRLLPLPPETIRILQCWLKSERPLSNAPEVFLSLKGPAGGRPMTPAGLRSLYRHHRSASGVPQANPHRFRHYAEFRTMPSKFVISRILAGFSKL
jgi:integrase